jgi:hypothetical protein
MGSTSSTVLEGGAHPGRLSTARGKKAGGSSTFRGDGRAWWPGGRRQGPAATGGNEVGDGPSGRGERGTRVELTVGGGGDGDGDGRG